MRSGWLLRFITGETIDSLILQVKSLKLSPVYLELCWLSVSSSFWHWAMLTDNIWERSKTAWAVIIAVISAMFDLSEWMWPTVDWNSESMWLGWLESESVFVCFKPCLCFIIQSYISSSSAQRALRPVGSWSIDIFFQRNKGWWSVTISKGHPCKKWEKWWTDQTIAQHLLSKVDQLHSVAFSTLLA